MTNLMIFLLIYMFIM